MNELVLAGLLGGVGGLTRGVVGYLFVFRTERLNFIAKKFPKISEYKAKYHQRKAEKLFKKGLKEKAEIHYKKAEEFEKYF